MMELIAGLKARGLNMPALLRFADIPSARIKQLYDAFGYGDPRLQIRRHLPRVYPIKVNQQKQVVAEIVEFGSPYHHGLKPAARRN